MRSGTLAELTYGHIREGLEKDEVPLRIHIASELAKDRVKSFNTFIGLEAVRGRKSVRAFKPELVPKELIEKILEATRWTPSAGNCQPREFIIVKNPEIKRRLCGAALHQDFIEETPVNIIVCANELFVEL